MSSDNTGAGHLLLTRLAAVGQRMRRVDRERPWVTDASLIAAVFFLFCVPDLVSGNDVGDPRNPPIRFTDLPVTGMLALQAGLLLPLMWRRRAPYAAFGAIAVVFLVQWSLGAFLRADFALLIALHSVTLHGRLRYLPWACAATVGLAVPVVLRVDTVVNPWQTLFFLLGAATAAIAIGFAVRVRQAQLVGLRERAAQLEIERDQRSKLAAATERTRVAREMHDIIGHNLSVIITLADGGAYAADASPERSKHALRLVGDTGRQALGELRRMLGVLREQADALELSPQPRIADLEALCARIHAAGPEVVYHSGGKLDVLDHGMQLMAYRIAQEALTNTLKHAGPDTRIDVAVTVEGSRLRVRVQDTGSPDGTGSTSTEEGHGIAGMRERAALYGGTVTAGPGPDRGWLVEAVLDDSPGGPA